MRGLAGRRDPDQTLPQSRHLVKPMPKIEIANPLPGSSKWASRSQADRYCRRGEAVMDMGRLRWLSDTEQRHIRRAEIELAHEGRQGSHVYVDGTWEFEIRTVGGWRFPHTQFLRAGATR